MGIDLAILMASHFVVDMKELILGSAAVFVIGITASTARDTDVRDLVRAMAKEWSRASLRQRRYWRDTLPFLTQSFQLT